MARTHRQHLFIAPGISRDGDRLVAVVRHGSARSGTQQRARQVFFLDPDGLVRPEDITRAQAWQLSAKRAFLLETSPQPGRGTLASDIPILLEKLRKGRYREDQRALLAHWAESPLGERARQRLTRADIIGQIARWRERGDAANSCNKRLSALRKLYDTLDEAIGGEVARSPADGVTYLKEPTPEPRAIPVHVIRFILDALPNKGRAERGQARPTVSHSKLRLSVQAWTGAAPSTIARIERRHIDLAKQQVFLPPREKGAGVDGRWVPLTPDAVEAVRAWMDAGLIGTQGSNASLGKTWRVGIKLAKVQARTIAETTGDRSWVDELAALPDNCRPYDLRHSFGTEAYRNIGDIRAVGELMQHRNLETTKRYTGGAVSERMAAAVAAMSAAMAAAPKPPTTATGRLRLVKKR